MSDPVKHPRTLSRVTMELVDEAAAILRGKRMAVVTGAGISTDSGIPDYRGEGSLPRTPMTFSQFVHDEDYRRRYWAGSQVGWSRFATALPNAGHDAITRLERAGLATGVITQNVDSLHQRSGTNTVVEVHGSGDRVVCMSCGQLYARGAVAETLNRQNPWLATIDQGELGPDGDVTVAEISELRVPACTVCGGVLRPDIVYFGELIPRARFAAARGLIVAADALLITGSSLVVNSGIRMLELAKRRGLPIVIVNRGVTKGDARATLKIDAGASPSLRALAERLIG